MPVKKLFEATPLIKFLIFGYFGSVAIGWALLLFFCRSNTALSGVDALFTVVSALSTTGLASIDIGNNFDFLGQLVLLFLMQLGGIGYLIATTFAVFALERKIIDYHKKKVSSLSILSHELTVTTLIKHIVAYTCVCEILGTLLLYIFFKIEAVEHPWWTSLFHSVSAFCTVGFTLFSNNLENYRESIGLNCVFSFLSLLGAFGFLIWLALFKKIKGLKPELQVMHLIQSFVVALVLLGTFLFLCATPFETSTLTFQRVMISFFHTISALTTAGFNTIQIGAIPLGSLLLLILLMLCGVSLTGNGANLRGTSFAAFIRLFILILRGKKSLSLRSQKILFKRIQIVLMPFVPYLLVLFISVLALKSIEDFPFFSLLFEAASALCTIGLSTGITAQLSSFGKILILFLMLIGRTGILFFTFAFSNQTLSQDLVDSKRQ